MQGSTFSKVHHMWLFTIFSGCNFSASGDNEQTEHAATISVIFCGYHLDFFMSNRRSQEGHS